MFFRPDSPTAVGTFCFTSIKKYHKLISSNAYRKVLFQKDNTFSFFNVCDASRKTYVYAEYVEKPYFFVKGSCGELFA